MFFKSILGLMALVLTLAPGMASAAKADAIFSVGGVIIGAGPAMAEPWGYHHHRVYNQPNLVFGFSSGAAMPIDSDYGYYRGYRSRISCGMGADIARSRGFRGVRPLDCSAPIYAYRGWKYGQPYDIRISARGRMVDASPSAW